MLKQILYLAALGFSIVSYSSWAPAETDWKSYNGNFCDPLIPGKSHVHRAHRFRFRDTGAVVCPIVRDLTGDNAKLPKIQIELYAAVTGSSPLSCSVSWQNEDSLGQIVRGISTTQSTNSTGKSQITFDSLSDYQGSGDLSLSSGTGEGSMALSCVMEDDDDIVQYWVDENSY